jgi:hypothetical protein
MSILRLVRNFALLAVLALAAHGAAGAAKHPHCGQGCSIFLHRGCGGGCKCVGGVFGAVCV